MKKVKKDAIYIFFIVLLSFLFVGLLILSISGWFYRDSNDSPTMLKIGESSVITLNGTQSEVLSFNFDGAFLSGEVLKQNISVKNASDKDLFVRAKLTVFTGENDDAVLNLITSEDWKEQEDGRYLFEGYISSLNTIGLCSGFIVSPEKQLKSSDAYILTISVEALSTEFDRLSVWGY